MIRIEKIAFIPKLEYTKYSMMELALAKDHLEYIQKNSRGMWVILNDETPLLVAGVMGSGLLNPPRLWFLLCDNFRDRVVLHLRGMKEVLKYLDDVYPRVETLVEKDWAPGLKFAKFCGFHQTKAEIEIYGRRLVVMER